MCSDNLLELARMGDGRQVDNKVFDDYKHLLPHAPEILVRIQDQLDSGEGDALVLAGLIESDASLVAKILRIVNSAYYQLPRELTDLRFAIAYLGFGEIHRIVLSASVLDHLSVPGVSFQRFWFHSYFTALIARELIKTAPVDSSAGEVWPLALLHDVGKLVSMRLFSEQYQQLEAYCEENQCLAWEAEKHLNMVPHTELGFSLCKHWGLPDAIGQICLLHEDPNWLNHSDLPRKQKETYRVVTVSNQIANLSMQQLDKQQQQAIHESICNLMACDQDHFLILMGRAYELRESAYRFLGTPEPGDHVEQLH